jgi:hypothetical protein
MLYKYKKIKYVSLLILFSFPALAEDSTSFGLSLGSPAGANFVIKSNALGIPMQISGGYWGDNASGIEIGYNFYQNTDSFLYSAQIVAGYTDFRENNLKSDIRKYAGFSATFKRGGFFIEPGLSFGSGDYSNPQLNFQIGWLWGL